jgi:hypothetical protein
MSNQELTKLQVKQLIYDWFIKLTDHAPVEEMISFLNPVNLEMQFPEKTLTSIEDFRQWYEKVTNMFFDQVHELKMLDIVIGGSRADVNLVVNWQARTWQPPAGYSKWEGVYAHQTWVVEAASNAHGAMITSYLVNKFDPMQGPLKIQ